MTTKTLLLIIATVFFFQSFSFCQDIEKVTFDPADSTDGYYLAIQPQSKNIKGVFVLLTSFMSPENLLPETKLHNVAYANDILTIVVSTKRKLYADSSTVSRLSTILQKVVARFSADTASFVLAGYDEAGNIALRYTELTYETPSRYLVQPKAVVGIDTPVDLFGMWHWSENQIKKNFWQGAVGDAKYYLDVMTKENGTIYNNPGKYKQLSPFNKNEETAGNEKYLQNIPVRLYYDTDIEWYLKNRRNSLYDTKIPDGSELVKRLLLAGNDRAEFIASTAPGMRSNGMRHPNSISIVNEVECIHWIKRCLNIFDENTWIAPYSFNAPKAWRTERFSLPPDFARKISYKGIEDIRFSPGWDNIKSDEHWTYSFLWWIDGFPSIDANMLKINLTAYYEGLVGRNVTSKHIPADKLIPTVVAIKETKPLPNDVKTFTGTITMLDYHTNQPITLHCSVHVKECKPSLHSAIYFEISPKPFVHPVWKTMNEIGDNFNCIK